MKKLIIVSLIFLFSMGCMGVVMTANKDNLNDDRKAGASWLWYDGHDNLADCVEEWNE